MLPPDGLAELHHHGGQHGGLVGVLPGHQVQGGHGHLKRYRHGTDSKFIGTGTGAGTATATGTNTGTGSGTSSDTCKCSFTDKAKLSTKAYFLIGWLPLIPDKLVSKMPKFMPSFFYQNT